ncbi:MAG: hypothetical protein H7837_12960 [Magnetococcus sp. MYC-9]
MATHLKNSSEGALRWQAIKQSLLLVTAIFFSTVLVVAFSTAVEKAAYFIAHSSYL